jgi:putative Holliday junction resolvase
MNSKILGIDYGEKRIGLAISDEMKLIAFPLKTVSSFNIFNFLEDFFLKNNVDTLVIGIPYSNSFNQNSNLAILIDNFVKKINTFFSTLKVEFISERFSSKIALFYLNSQNLPKNKRKKENIDMISASIILQSFLDKKNQK